MGEQPQVTPWSKVPILYQAVFMGGYAPFQETL